MSDQWLGLASGLLLAVTLIALAGYGLWGGRLRLLQRRRFVCPLFHTTVDCWMVRDIRTGQWKHVRSCSAFVDASDVRCAGDCAALMNLGFPLAGEQGRP